MAERSRGRRGRRPMKQPVGVFANQALHFISQNEADRCTVPIQEFLDNSCCSGPLIHSWHHRQLGNYGRYPFNAKHVSMSLWPTFDMQFENCMVFEYSEDGHGIPFDSDNGADLEQCLTFAFKPPSNLLRNLGRHGTGWKNTMLHLGPLSVILTAAYKDDEEVTLERSVALFGCMLHTDEIADNILLRFDRFDEFVATIPSEERTVDKYLEFLREAQSPDHGEWYDQRFLFTNGAEDNGTGHPQDDIGVSIPFKFLVEKLGEVGSVNKEKKEEAKEKTGLTIFTFLWKNREHTESHLPEGFSPCEFSLVDNRLKFRNPEGGGTYDLHEEMCKGYRFMTSTVEGLLRRNIVVQQYHENGDPETFTYDRYYADHAFKHNGAVGQPILLFKIYVQV